MCSSENWFRSKTRIGGTKNINIDKVLSLQPDIVFANKEENTQTDIEALAQHVPVWISDIKTIDSSFAMMRAIGNICQKTNEAEIITEKIEHSFQQVSLENKSSVAYLIWYNPWMAAGKDTFITEMLSKAGFTNIISDLRYPEIDLKNIKADIFFLSSEPYPFKEKHIAEIKSLHPDAKCILVDGEIFSWYGSRMLHAADYFRNLQRLIYNSA